MEDAFASRLQDDQAVRWAVSQLAEVGFLSIPGPFSSERLGALIKTYDDMMAAACGPNFNFGSSTTRMSDLLSFDGIFEEVFLYEPLLAIASRFFEQEFKVSSFLGRTLRPDTPVQELHSDIPRNSEDAPLLGFILMIDPFLRENGATRFVPRSHRWPGVPAESMADTRTPHLREQVCCGASGTMVLFDASIWHGHTANVTSHPRRSIQGYFVRRNARQGVDFRSVLADRVRARLNPIARYLLALEETR